MLRFESQLLQTARQALKEGKIEKDDFRRVLLASFFPRLMKKLEAYVTTLAVEEAVMTAEASKQAIDWAKFQDFLKTVLPLILEFLKAIGAFN